MQYLKGRGERESTPCTPQSCESFALLLITGFSDMDMEMQWDPGSILLTPGSEVRKGMEEASEVSARPDEWPLSVDSTKPLLSPLRT